MKVLLYNDHHNLPFWHQPTQPKVLFDPKAMEMYKEEGLYTEKLGEDGIFFAKNSATWPILMGLYNLKLNKAIAHVSIIFNKETEKFSHPKRVWVQISTEPNETTPDGIPMIIKNGEVTVKSIWGEDNGTYTPTQLIKEVVSDLEKSTPEFWSDFFRTKVCEVSLKMKNEYIYHEDKLAKLKQDIQELDAILATKPR